MKLSKEDTERLNELKARVWAYTAKKLMNGDPNPYEIKKDNIEDHKGRIDKALRLLDSYTEYTRTDKVKTGWGFRSEEIYTITHLDESLFIGIAPQFNLSIQFLHDEIFNQEELTEKSDIDTVGYRALLNLKDIEIIYVYWHQDEYLFLKTNVGTLVLPRALNDSRTKTMLRAVIDQYFHNNFHSRLEKYLGIAEGSINHEDHFSLSIRNFAAHGYRFSIEAYYGTNGFQQEYQHYHDYFEALLKNLARFKEIIDAAGGHSEIVKSYRKEIIDQLLMDAPLYAFQPVPDFSNLPYEERPVRAQKLYKNPFLYGFLLANAQFFDYETLYDGDTTILVIDAMDQCIRVEETAFHPERKELDMIESSR